MIIVRLEGGLGNQMFQYATGRYLSVYFRTELLLDTSAYTTRQNLYFTPRTYELDIFNTKNNLIEPVLLDKYYIYPKNIREKIKGKINRLFDHFKVVYEANDVYQKNILHAGSNCYLIGYWQDEKYFSEIRSLLLEEFTFSHNVIHDVQTVLEEIQATNSIGIHVRRGDYITNSVFANYYHECSIDYYKSAIQMVKKSVPDTKLFFFSDEPDWILRNFSNISDFKIVHYNQPGYDLFLMSQCKHNIIANSSYSWWAAYLNQNKNKIVIAPQKWFINSTKNPSCKEWTLI